MTEIVEGDLLESGLKIIAHQCNCITRTGKGLARVIFDRFPYANFYGLKRNVGNCVICEPIESKSSPIVAGIIGQINPGKPNRTETKEKRLAWFDQGLKGLAAYMTEHKLDTVGFPYGVGCGLAGGNWNDYFEAIEKFSLLYSIKVKIYKLS